MRTVRSGLGRDALSILKAALEAADAGNAVRRHFSSSANHLRAGALRIPLKDFDRVFLIGAGKAAVQMAAAASRVLPSALSGGIVITKYGHAGRGLGGRVSVIEAGHPIPDEHGLAASQQVRDLLSELNARDLLIVVISGGASALLAAPAGPVTLAAKQQTTDLLLRAGAKIAELNAVRKHLSALKGGRLAALAYPATVVSLLLSDVIGDPIDIIGSGPTAPDPATFRDALAVLDKYELTDRVPESVRDHLRQGAAGNLPETPKPGDPLFQNVYNIVVGSNRLAIEAAAAKGRSLGYRTLILSSTVQGETREVARVHGQILREIRSSGHPIRPPACVLSGGETTVTVRGNGKGGRNLEFALAAALEIAGLKHALVLSAGSDGTDGPTDAAGAIATGETLSRGAGLGLDAAAHLRANDSYPFFDSLGDLIRTGPTGTNVMDIHLLLAF
ncbi:MAG TPA: glycerate kinase [Bryobacteraceae bacterium]|nr:glycerate kinase [Bryobacteraceae bacterium]